MKTISDFSDAGGGKRLPATTPTVAAATSEQVHTLLQAALCMNQHLLSPDDNSGDKNARDAACATFVNITNRLDAIFSEDNRWRTESYDEITSSLNEMYKAQTQYLQKAGKLADEDRKRILRLESPHARRAVSVHCLNNGQFLFVDGDPTDPSAIKALGDTPEEAAREFDDIWAGKIPYQPFKVGSRKNSEEESNEVGGGLPS
jgi:hypothetical protein